MTAIEQTRSARELAKSALSLSWAISLLSINRVVGWFGNAQPREDMLTPLTQATTGQLGQFMQGIYRSGDNIQARIVDFAFSWFEPRSWVNPDKWGFLFSGPHTASEVSPGTKQSAPPEAGTQAPVRYEGPRV